MLKELYIENLAVIEKATIDFCESFNAFTGETGAGKSILIGGINAVLGQRVTKDIVRSGTDKAVISALFTKIPKTTEEKLSELGFSAQDGQIVITREISSDGGSVARINSRAVTVSVLREIGETLINIHGQHDNQILLAPERHIQILDNYSEAKSLLDSYHQSFKELQETARKINQLTLSEKQKELRIAELSELVDEISELEISENEDEQIEDEYSLMKNSVSLSEAVNNVLVLLSGGDDFDGAVTMADNAGDELGAYSELFSDLEPLTARLKSASIELDDISSELLRLLSRLELDPSRFEFVKSRREELRKIKRKYGPELSDVLEKYEKASDELLSLSDTDNELLRLNERKSQLLGEVSRKAKELSAYREKSAKRFIEQVCEELRFLDMPNVTLAVAHEKGKLTANGMDKIEFLISANAGENPKPIAKIASGGELSRIMLALKNVIADKDDIPTLIFDEIDTGVSGRAAQKIGRKLAEISRIRQVLCVTHLAQLAVMADNHLLIEKNVVADRTVTTVKSLDFEERKLEIARIMGGDAITELMLENAGELLKSAHNGM